jgi:hypothetical protein
MNPYINYVLEDFIDYLNLEVDKDEIDSLDSSFDKKLETKGIVHAALKEIEILKKEHNVEITENDFKQIDEFFKNRLPDFFNDAKNPEALRQEFIDNFFIKKVTLTEKNQIDYLKQIAVFNKTQQVADLYDFGHIFDNENTENFQSELFEMVSAAKDSHKAELLSNVSVFIENFYESKIGRNFIRNYEFSSPHDWFDQLFNHMKNHSPIDIGIKKDPKTNNFYTNLQNGGVFDGLYIIPMMEKENALEVKISATASLGPDIETDSVARHTLSNILLSQSFDKYLEEQVEVGNYLEKVQDISFEDFKNISDDQVFKVMEEVRLNKAKKLVLQDILKEGTSKDYGFGNNLSNPSLKHSLSRSIEKFIFKENNEEPAEFLSNLKKLTKDPLFYYKESMGLSMNEKVSVEDVENLLINFDNTVIQQKSVFANYHPPMRRKKEYADKSTLWKDVFEKDKMTPENFRSGVQLLGLMDYNFNETIDIKNFDEEAIQKLFEKAITLRSFCDNGKRNDIGFDKDFLKNIEKTVIENFVFKNREEIYYNQMSLDKYGSRKSVKNYMEFLSDAIDTEEKYKNKMESLGIKGYPEYISVLKNLSEIILDDNSKIAKSFNRILKKEISERERIVAEEKISVAEEKISVVEEKISVAEEKISVAESKLLEKDVELLNLSLEFDNALLLKNNEELKIAHGIFKEMKYDGLEKKVTVDDFKNKMSASDSLKEKIKKDEDSTNKNKTRKRP